MLKKELLKGDISTNEYDEFINETKMNIPEHELSRSPEFREQALKIAQKEFIKGNIDEQEYNKIKAYSIIPVAETISDKVPLLI